MVAPLREPLQELLLHNGGKNCFSYYSRQGEKRQFKKTNQKPTLCTCRLFLLKQIFQYISKFKRQQRDKLEPTTTQFINEHSTIQPNSQLANWLSVRLRTKWLCVPILLLLFKLQTGRLLQARSSLTYRQTIECGFSLKLVRDMIILYSHISIYSI